MRTNKATIAICYDFDGTLIEGNMQENSFIPKLKQSKEAFWGSVKKRAEDHDMDEVLAYMQIMLEKASEEKVSTKKKALKAHGGKLIFFTGVKEWFDLIDDYVNNKPVKIQHFIISSGIDEMIKGSEIGKNLSIFLPLVFIMMLMMLLYSQPDQSITLRKFNICSALTRGYLIAGTIKV